MRRRRALLDVFAIGALVFGMPLAGAAEKNGEKEVTANEDLMREHGVLRRALLVYHGVAERLRRDAATAPTAPLLAAAKLFREFGEDYHERRLEEKFIFPAVRKLKGDVAHLPDVLEQQHERGRELNAWVMELARAPRIPQARAVPLANALDQFVLMYGYHAAREDTVVFTAWKDSLSGKAYKEMGERFEDIEKQVFGHDGFEDAVKRIAAIEAELGLADIGQFTIPSPPH